jgi:undecaprenyl-diphosphatase
MGELIEAVILGFVQGLTEFLPVSSSGHLELAKWMLQDDAIGQQSLLMTVVLHGATALATVMVFFKDILQIFKGLFEMKWNDQKAFVLKIIISMLPAVIVGLLFEEIIESLFSQRIILVGAMLMVTAVLLYFADQAKNTLKKVGYVDAAIIGISQAIAILPGISRSGATISTSVLLGIDRARAARFSFLMVVPLIFGKLAKDVLDGEMSQESVELLPLLVGFLAALIAGILACTWMIILVRKARLSYFAIYCVIVGVVAILFQLSN